jgi:hypothetical protein
LSQNGSEKSSWFCFAGRLGLTPAWGFNPALILMPQKQNETRKNIKPIFRYFSSPEEI